MRNVRKILLELVLILKSHVVTLQNIPRFVTILQNPLLVGARHPRGAPKNPNNFSHVDNMPQNHLRLRAMPSYGQCLANAKLNFKLDVLKCATSGHYPIIHHRAM